MTIASVRPLGSSGEHFSVYFEENLEVKHVFWRCSPEAKNELIAGNIISVIITLSKNIWN